MDLFEQFDGYCERTDLSYWSEPINAVTNLAFVLAALLMWRRTGGAALAGPLCLILGAIGIGSYLFHTHATGWAALTDVIPIGLFILVYLFGVNRHLLHWPLWASLLGVAAFLPFAWSVTTLAFNLPFFKVSSFYWSVPLLIFLYATFLLRWPTARDFALGAALLCLSITFRSLDITLCDQIPLGTHFLWHILNAIMLGWMIESYHRARLRLAGGLSGR